MQVIKEHFETKGYTADKHVEVEVAHDDDHVVSAESAKAGWNVQVLQCA